jgi:hypothetical protein
MMRFAPRSTVRRAVVVAMRQLGVTDGAAWRFTGEGMFRGVAVDLL